MIVSLKNIVMNNIVINFLILKLEILQISISNLFQSKMADVEKDFLYNLSLVLKKGIVLEFL